MAEIDLFDGKKVFENLTSETIVELKLKNPVEQLKLECKAKCSDPCKSKCLEEQAKLKDVMQNLYDFALKMQGIAKEYLKRCNLDLDFMKLSKE